MAVPNEEDVDKLFTYEEIAEITEPVAPEVQKKDSDQERWEKENKELGFDTDLEDDLDVEFIKKPPKLEHKWDLDELFDEHAPDPDEITEIKPPPPVPEIDIASLEIHSVEEALRLAEQVILVLEEDVAAYFLKAGVALEDIDKVGREVREKISGDSLSISSNKSLVLEGEPSTLRLFYEKGVNPARVEEIPHIHGIGIDETCEVVLHRTRKYKKHEKPTMVPGFSQTRAMAFIPEDKAGMIFMKIYPQPDDYVPPEEATRKLSLEMAIKQADNEDPNVDKETQRQQQQQGPNPKVMIFSNRKKILPPLRDDYYKEEAFWTGSKFKGHYKNRQFYKGHYDHPTGVTYESEWKDGHFHSTKHHGIMEYPRGDTFEGEWINGRYVSGEITFADGLKYNGAKDWNYCDAHDRRLRSERYFGMRPAGDTIYNDQFPNQKLPPGCYDIGDGIYNPKTGEICGYDGFFMRLANEKEHMWIVSACRKQLTHEEEYVPTFNPDRLPGTYVEQAQKFTLTKRNYH